MRIKEVRKRFAEREIAKWEYYPILFAIIIPNIFEPEWFWRLLSAVVASLCLFILAVHTIFIPEQILQSRYNQSVKYKKPLFWVFYITAILLIPFALFFALLPTSGDLYRTIQNRDEALSSKIVHIIKTEGGGSVSPWFIGQTLRTGNEEYTLPFSFRGIRRGTYEIIYSPHTNIVYEITPVK